MSQISETGVSVIICCHNSSKRIIKTLQALAAQKFVTSILWEVILVDNASTDDTAKVAIKEWEKLGIDIELLVVQESKPGLGLARKKGISQSSYPIVLFCDDDNWLFPDYIQVTHETLTANDALGACGGMGIPVFETAEPAWFHEYSEAFAVGPQQASENKGGLINLYGAGLAIRKKALKELQRMQFQPLLQGRSGAKLSSSEDTELTYAFVLMGYQLHYTENLKFYHFLPKERLNIVYLRKLFAAFGEDGPIRNLYYAHITNRFFHKKIRKWLPHFLLSIIRLMKYFISPPKANGRLTYLNWNLAYIRKLVGMRPEYELINSRISAIQKYKDSTPSYSTSSLHSAKKGFTTV